jgi:uncharacterized protein
LEEANVVVAFSGGLDSSLVLWAAVQALGSNRVRAAHISWGAYSYSQLQPQVLSFARSLGLEPDLLQGQADLEKTLRGGPACNRCTRQAKLGLLRRAYPVALILTGANRSDSWGQRGQPLLNGILAPLFHLEKEAIRSLAAEAGLDIRPIGESSRREGCKAKHLLKPLVTPGFHGRAVAVANEILLQALAHRQQDALPQTGLANVKIYGPLRENHAIINVLPALTPPEEAEVRFALDGSGLSLASVRVARAPLMLTVVASPALIGDAHARQAVEEGILAPGFAVPLHSRWVKSDNKRLLSFHVVEAIEIIA